MTHNEGQRRFEVEIADAVSVLHNHADRRFEMQAEGQVASVSYRLEGNHVILDHTYVPEALRGRGLAAQLVRAALARLPVTGDFIC